MEAIKEVKTTFSTHLEGAQLRIDLPKDVVLCQIQIKTMKGHHNLELDPWGNQRHSYTPWDYRHVPDMQTKEKMKMFNKIRTSSVCSKPHFTARAARHCQGQLGSTNLFELRNQRVPPQNRGPFFRRPKNWPTGASAAETTPEEDQPTSPERPRTPMTISVTNDRHKIIGAPKGAKIINIQPIDEDEEMPELIDADDGFDTAQASSSSIENLIQLFKVATKPVDNRRCPEDVIGPASPVTSKPKGPAMSPATPVGPPPSRTLLDDPVEGLNLPRGNGVNIPLEPKIRVIGRGLGRGSILNRGAPYPRGLYSHKKYDRKDRD